MDHAADQALGPDQVVARTGQEPGVEEGVDRVAAAPPGTVIIGLGGAARHPGWPIVNQAEQGLAAVVHRHDPVGQAEHRLAGPRIARQVIVMHQPGRIIVFIAWTSAVGALFDPQLARE